MKKKNKKENIFEIILILIAAIMPIFIPMAQDKIDERNFNIIQSGNLLAAHSNLQIIRNIDARTTNILWMLGKLGRGSNITSIYSEIPNEAVSSPYYVGGDVKYVDIVACEKEGFSRDECTIKKITEDFKAADFYSKEYDKETVKANKYISEEAMCLGIPCKSLISLMYVIQIGALGIVAYRGLSKLPKN